MTTPAEQCSGLILFAHGARDPLWAEPLLLLLEKVRQAAPSVPAEVAFLESMTPDLNDAVARLVAAGSVNIRIVPIFFGRGGHLRRDLPELVTRVQAKWPRTQISTAVSVGEDEAVLDALTQFCLRALESTSART